MYKFSLITTLCLYLLVNYSLAIALLYWFLIFQKYIYYYQHTAQGEGYIAGKAKWNATGKALKEEEFDTKYFIGPELNGGGAFSTLRRGKHEKPESIPEWANLFS